jgi:sugar phosphate isomerase/epimerase
MGEYAKLHNVTLAIENLFPFKLDYYAPLPNEIAKQLNKINHPNIKCCLDISHAYINCTYHNAHLVNELKSMGPLSEHIHMHDSFGNIERIWTYIDAENTSYGQGDLHLPLGWGDIPFDKIFEEVEFPDNINLNFELPIRYEKYYKESIAKARMLLEKL